MAVGHKISRKRSASVAGTFGREKVLRLSFLHLVCVCELHPILIATATERLQHLDKMDCSSLRVSERRPRLESQPSMHRRSPTPEPPRRVDVWEWEQNRQGNDNRAQTSHLRSCFTHLIPREAKVASNQDRSMDVANFLRENNPPRRNRFSTNRHRTQRKLVKRALAPNARRSSKWSPMPSRTKPLTQFAPKGVIPRISKDGMAVCLSW